MISPWVSNIIIAFLYISIIMKKHTVIETLDSFEDEFDAEKLIEKLLFIEKVEKGLRDVDEGRVQDYNEVKQKFADKWSK